METDMELRAETLHGIAGQSVQIRVEHRAGGKLAFAGWKEAAAREIEVRLRGALWQTQIRLDDDRGPLVRLDREDWTGSELDLPVAVALLAFYGRVPAAELSGMAFAAELSLDGRLRPVRGVVSLAEAARERGARTIVVAEENRHEAELVGGLRVETPKDLAGVLELLDWGWCSEYLSTSKDRAKSADAWRAAAAAVDAGNRFVLLVGCPGAGKTILARALASRLPAMTDAERLEVLRVHSAAGLATSAEGSRRLDRSRPFRAPHHSCSLAGLLGGGLHCRPGEVSLAHRGTLHLDEANEFSMRTIDELAGALLRESVSIARGSRAVCLPAMPRLVVASMNPCPCGYFGSSQPGTQCRCTPDQRNRYGNRGIGRLGELVECTVRLP